MVQFDQNHHEQIPKCTVLSINTSENTSYLYISTSLSFKVNIKPFFIFTNPSLPLASTKICKLHNTAMTHFGRANTHLWITRILVSLFRRCKTRIGVFWFIGCSFKVKFSRAVRRSQYLYALITPDEAVRNSTYLDPDLNPRLLLEPCNTLYTISFLKFHPLKVSL